MDLITPANLGRLGGQKTSELYGKEHYRKMQQLGVKSKKKKKSEATLVLDKR